MPQRLQFIQRLRLNFPLPLISSPATRQGKEYIDSHACSFFHPPLWPADANLWYFWGWVEKRKRWRKIWKDVTREGAAVTVRNMAMDERGSLCGSGKTGGLWARDVIVYVCIYACLYLVGENSNISTFATENYTKLSWKLTGTMECLFGQVIHIMQFLWFWHYRNLTPAPTCLKYLCLIFFHVTCCGVRS